MAEADAPAQGTNEGTPELDESKLPKFSEIDPANTTPEQVAELAKVGQTLLGQMKHWHDKAIDKGTGKPYKDLLADAQAKIPQNQPAPPAQTPPESEGRIAKLEQAEEKRQFGHAHDLTPEETDHVFGYAVGMGLKPAEALESAFIKQSLPAWRQAQKNSDATPGPSARSPMVEGKSFNEMKPDEKRKNFPAVVQELSRKK